VTDARYPERWLADRRLLLLSDQAHRLFVTGLVFSVANRTDGRLTDADLELMPRVDTTSVHELVDSRLWRREADHWLIVEFEATQTTRSELETLEKLRAAERDKKRRQRAKQAEERSRPGDSPRDSPRGTSGGTALGQDKDKVKAGQEHEVQLCQHCHEPSEYPLVHGWCMEHCAPVEAVSS
jgi:hypothetical protein